DAISGEASLGTLRYLLVRPSGRSRLLADKGATSAPFCLAGAAVVAAAGLLAGVVLFPIGRLVTLSGTTVSLGEGMLRTLAAAGVVGVSLMGLASIGLFVSTLTDAPVGAMAATAGFAVLSAVRDVVPETRAFQPWLFAHHWLSFGVLLRSPVQWSGIVADLRLQLGYIVVFAAAAWAR